MKKAVFLIFVILIVFSSCKESNDYTVDISDIDIEIQVQHFEKDLFQYSIDSSDYFINKFKQNYGEFFRLYCLQIVELGDPDEEYISFSLNEFIRYWKPKEIDRILSEEFPDFENEQLPEIEKAFKYYKYYFEDKYIPDIISYFSSFGYSVVTLDSITGIGLDKYLGLHNEDIYDKVGYPYYQKRRMVKEMIPVDIMRSTAESEFPFVDTDTENLLDHMIYNGKVQYFLNCMLPETADTLKWMYTKKQLSWAFRHEKKIWDYIADQKLLYSTDNNDIRKMTGDGPYTSIFTDVSAPRAGVFIGFRIVEKYMQNNSDIHLKELMEETDSRKILSEAKYNP
jgi:hypothetical protein